jgi:hypothetical protein
MEMRNFSESVVPRLRPLFFEEVGEFFLSKGLILSTG